MPDPPPRPLRPPQTLRDRVGVSRQTYEVDASAAADGLRCKVTIDWIDPGKPTSKAARDAVAERMKRLDEGAKFFLDAMYPIEG